MHTLDDKKPYYPYGTTGDQGPFLQTLPPDNRF